jgi:lipoprotein-anchoring transpeptidase ErfK/SrfK
VSNTQRATILLLVIAAIGIWGLGLRAAVRPGARAEQESAAGPTATEAPTAGTPTMDSELAAASTQAPEAASATPTRGATHTSSATATASPSATPSASATATRRPSRIPSQTPTTTPQITPTPAPSPIGSPTIPQMGRFLLVHQDGQVMRVYEDGIEIRAIPVSTGRPVQNGFTPAWRGDVGRYWGSGPFLDTDLYSDYMWYLFPGARGSILIHSVPYTWDGDLKVYDRPDALGVEPASHGCVRISTEDARWLKSWDPVGVPIEITPWSGAIGPPDESL